MVELFDWLNDISNNKKNLMCNDTVKSYNSYLISMMMGRYPDCVLLVNELNKSWNVSSEMHHDFLFYSIPKKKRFAKGIKVEKIEAIDYICRFYQCSKVVAQEYCKLMKDEDLIKIIKLYKERK